jgi:hypothetical protein
MRQLPPWMPWAATIAVAVVIIIIAARVEGLKIQTSEQELEAQLDGVPGRETVYPGHISAPPTIVAPQATEEVIGLEKPPSKYRLKMSVALRSGPGTEYAKAMDLAEGDEVWGLGLPIEVQGKEWRQIKTDEGQVGWCMTKNLTPVSPGE